MKAKCFIILKLFLVLLITSGVQATPYPSYTYNMWGEPVSAPHAYLPIDCIGAVDIGVDLGTLRDMVTGPDGTVYLLDSRLNRILLLDSEFKLHSIIDGFNNNEVQDTFNDPRGLFISADKDIYVADTGNGRLVRLSQSGELIRIIGHPEGPGQAFAEDLAYRPTKIGVDPIGRIYVVAEDIFDGFLQFDADGRFRGFIGAPRVTPSITDLFWYRLATDEQRERMPLFLPIEYNSLAIDERGFIYATVPSGTENEMVKRLNPAGLDVLRREGFFAPMGDVKYIPRAGGYTLPGMEGRTMFVDVLPRPFGMYSVLDHQRGRIFTYDYQGNLLYVFGGPGDQLGLFRNPVALAAQGDKLLVADGTLNSVTIFEPTDYGSMIHLANEAYLQGLYDQATDSWQSILLYNVNYDLAYSGIGKSLLRKGQYEDALTYFRLGNDRRGYSEALLFYRRELIGRQFGTIAFVLLGAILITNLIRRTRLAVHLKTKVKKWRSGLNPSATKDCTSNKIFGPIGRVGQLQKGLQYAFYVIFHPFDGFWDLKHEKKGNIGSATVLLMMLVVTYILTRQYTGFLFSTRNVAELNVYIEIISVLVPFLLWCIVNWSLTTLMEGKGTLSDIYINAAYAMVPMILVNLPLTAASNYMTLPEGHFYQLALTFSIVFSGILLLLGTLVLNEYSMVKAITTCLVTLVGIGFVLFMFMMYVTLMNQIYLFLSDVFTEIVFRM